MFQIRAVPTLAFFKNGEFMDGVMGAPPAAILRRKLEQMSEILCAEGLRFLVRRFVESPNCWQDAGRFQGNRPMGAKRNCDDRTAVDRRMHRGLWLLLQAWILPKLGVPT